MRRIRKIVNGTATCAILALVVMPVSALADFKVHSPDAEYGEFEIEEVGSWGTSGNPATNNEQSFVHELGYGVTNWWHTELEFETNRDFGPGNHLRLDQLTAENQFVFGEPGQYWLDPGFFCEYGQAMVGGNPNETTFGPTLRKEFFHTINTVNLFFEKDIGQHSAGHLNFLYAWETRVALDTPVEPGFQAYGTVGPVGKPLPISQQDHRIGPMLFTTISDLGPGTLKANGGILFGLTPGEPRRTLRWQLEYELHF